MNKRKLLILVVTLGTLSRAFAAPISVPGTANPWLVDADSAAGGDTAPAESPVIVALVDFVAGDNLSFTVTGSVSYGGGTPTDPPDGDLFGFRNLYHLGDSTNGGPENGLAGLGAPANALVGAFVGPTIPTPGPTPQPFLDFATTGNSSIDYTTLTPALNQPFFIGDGLNASSVRQSVTVPTGATRLVLGPMDGTGWYNNSGSFSVTIFASGAEPTPTPPPHGGLSATQFTVNGSNSGSIGVKDTVLRFSALQVGQPADLKVRVQWTITPNDSGSWTDLANGSGGYMTIDKTTGYFVLNATNYPLQNGVSFRALSSAPGYPDSISNVVGTFNLATSTLHVGPSTLFIATNGAGQVMDFRVKKDNPPAGITFRIQATTTPGNEESWTDLADGNDGHMYPFDDPTLFYLHTKAYPPGDAVYFRALGTVTGRIDSISNHVGVEHLVVGPTPEMEILPPPPEAGSGSGLSPNDPIVVSAGTITFGVQLAMSGTLSELAVIYDGTVLETRGGGTSFTLPYTTNVGGDHILGGYGINSQGIKGFAPPVYIRIKPPLGKIFTRVSPGNWNEAAKWNDPLGATGVPGANDFAILSGISVSVTQDVTVYGVSLNGGTITGAGGGLTVTQSFTIAAGQLKNLNTTVGSSGTLSMISDTDVPMSGSLTINGTFKLSGRGSLVPVPGSATAQSLGAPLPNGFFDGIATAIHNLGTWIVQKLSKPAAPVPVPPVNPIPVELPRAIVASSFENLGKLIGPNGAALLSENGLGLIAPNGATLIGNDGASLITNDGGSLITNDGGSLITNDGGSIISNDGASIVAQGGGNGPTRLGAPATSGLIQSSGETDLSGLIVIGDVSLEGGVLSGSGAIAGTLTNSGGYVSPGHSAGRISVVGNFSQTAGGTLIVENGGPLPNDFDQLTCTGTATLGGNLDVKLINGYTPDPADTFNPIGAGAVSGSFASVSANGTATVTADGVLLSTDPAIPSPQAAQPLNISTRLNVQTNDNVLIAGFIVNGPAGATKKVLIRALGPSLPLSGALADPVLELHPSGGAVITNDNWKSDQQSEIAATGLQPTSDSESAIIATLPVGAHTAIVKGQNDGFGIGLVEVYDLEGDNLDVQLANISTRGKVETGDNVMIGGFIIGGTEPTTVLVRALGPSLSASGVTGVLANPVLELHDLNGNVTLNDDWRSTQALEIENSLPPSNDAESALSITLVPGAYTAIVRGSEDSTGVALVEVYNLQ
ncbi:MAG: hypothetical protein ABIR29_13060 [Chthoniobacterales bacterium]